MFGAAHLRTTFHLSPTAPRGSLRLGRYADANAAGPTAGLLRRIEHTLAAGAAASTIEGVDLSRPLSMSVAPATGVLRLELAAREPHAIEASLPHLAALLALEGVTRVEVRLVDPATASTLAHRSIEAPAP